MSTGDAILRVFDMRCWDIVIASTFFGGVYHYQGELILIVHTSGSNNSFLSGFAVIYTDPYLSLEILYLWHVSMNPRELCHRTDRNAKLSTVYNSLLRVIKCSFHY